MYRQETVLKLKPLFESYLQKQGFILVDLRLYKNRDRRLVLEVLADRSEGGITLDECTQLNREMGQVIEASGCLYEEYTLDVSSPGLDRPLVVPSDFRRVIGRDVRVFLKEPLGEKLEYRGVVKAAEDDNVLLKTKEAAIQIPMDKLNKAKQVIS